MSNRNKDNETIDNSLNVLVESGTYFVDADIIPTVQYQVFGLDNVWFWDNEGQNYNYTGGPSKFNIQVVVGTEKEYYEVVADGKLIFSSYELQPGDEIKGQLSTEDIDNDNVPEDAIEGDIYYCEREILNPGILDLESDEPYEFNKFGKEKLGKVVYVTIDPNLDLSEEYPGAIVTINGKEHDLNYLQSPIRLYMDRDYRISINWVWGELVETFRIICNR